MIKKAQKEQKFSLTFAMCFGIFIGYHYASEGIVYFEMEEPLKWQKQVAELK